MCNYCYLKCVLLVQALLSAAKLRFVLWELCHTFMKKGTKPITLNKMKLMLIVAFAFRIIVGASAQCDVLDCIGRYSDAVSSKIIMSKSI